MSVTPGTRQLDAGGIRIKKRSWNPAIAGPKSRMGGRHSDAAVLGVQGVVDVSWWMFRMFVRMFRMVEDRPHMQQPRRARWHVLGNSNSQIIIAAFFVSEPQARSVP